MTASSLHPRTLAALASAGKPGVVWTLGSLVDLCRSSFLEALAYVFAWRGFKVAKIHRMMGAVLDDLVHRRCLRASILGFRGVNKTTLAQIFTACLLLQNPRIKIMVLSAALRHAKKFIKGLRTLLTNCPIFRHLRPRGRAENTKTQFDVAGVPPDTDASVAAYGVETQITGTHVDAIITDDIEIPDNSDTADKREGLGEVLDECEAILNPGGVWVNIGTYQHPDSVHARFESDPDTWRLVKIPCRDAAGNPTYPERFPDRVLRHLEASMSKAFWRLHYMLDRNLDDLADAPVRISNLVRAYMPNVKLSLFLDPSGCTGGDEVGYAAAGVAGERRELIYFQELGGILKDLDPTSEDICDLVETYKIDVIWYESNMPGSRHFVDTIKRHLYARRLRPSFRDYPVKGNKHARIINQLEPLSERRSIVMNPPVLEGDEGAKTVDQFRKLTYKDLPKPRDRIDVCAFAAEILAGRTSSAAALYPMEHDVDDDRDDDDGGAAVRAGNRMSGRVSMLRKR